ncbi:MAG: pantoate--beta-alanine ligase [candidate division KSB1 bacterium]|nr:pantoate--beta-alanine ligase [candidate division KSB1 bacterium]
MDVTHNIQDTRRILKNLSPETQIGLVPTMGALHEGHAALIRQSVADNDYTAISIFVNPLQFGEHEDLDQYPKTLNADVKMADDLSVDLVFNPNAREILGERMLAFVDIDELQDNLCGASRPGHFRGVCTIVSKLFHIIQPHQAYFGEKDIQQLIIIQRMVQDLNFPVRIVPCPLVREPDGLAKSSRNRYLSPDERKQALVLSRAIGKVVQLYRSGERSAAVLVQEAENRIKTAPDAVIDYVQFVNGSMQDVEYVRDDTILALAVFVGETRLIDNHIMHRKFSCDT